MTARRCAPGLERRDISLCWVVQGPPLGLSGEHVHRPPIRQTPSVSRSNTGEPLFGLLPPEREPSWPGTSACAANAPEVWTDLISHSFVPLTARPVGDQPLYGRLQAAQRGPIGLARIEGSAQHVLRGKRELARSSDKVVYLNIQLSGVGHVRNRLGDARTAVGTGVVVPSYEAYELGFERPFIQFCVTMGADWLSERLGMPTHALTTRHLDLTQGVGRVVRAALAAMVEAEHPEEHEVCADLFARALVDGVRQPASLPQGQIGRGLLIVELKRLIARRLGEAGLTPALAAAELGCSLSTLHLHCQKAGQSFGAMLAEARLTAAAKALRLTPPAHGRVAFVAYACGFTDPAHFSRKFRARFGVPPGRYLRW